MSNRTVFTYDPSLIEYFTRQDSMTLERGDKVRLAAAPRGGKGLPNRFRWVEDMNGNFLGMVLRNSLVKS
jgi:hypothetical protein